MKYYSQYKQDEYIHQNYFKNKTNGLVVDLGSSDGLELSNSLFFEKELKWKSICVEPIPSTFEKLINNRINSECHNCAISDENGEVEFLKIDGYSEMLSSIVSKLEPQHLERINNEIIAYNCTKEIINIKAITFDTLMGDRTEIDYLSIDVEGAEFDIIKTIDFNKYNINVMSIENNYNNQEMINYIISKGYQLVIKLGIDDIYKKR